MFWLINNYIKLNTIYTRHFNITTWLGIIIIFINIFCWLFIIKNWIHCFQVDFNFFLIQNVYIAQTYTIYRQTTRTLKKWMCYKALKILLKLFRCIYLDICTQINVMHGSKIINTIGAFISYKAILPNSELNNIITDLELYIILCRSLNSSKRIDSHTLRHSAVSIDICKEW